jgi:PAS domain S-box-containing protein
MARTASGKKSRSNRSVAARTFAVLLLLCLIPIALLGYYAYRLSAGSTDRLIHAHNLFAASMTRALVENELAHWISVLNGFAGNPDFSARVKSHDEEAVRQRLAVLVNAHEKIVRAFVTDPAGTLWSDFPKAPESLQQNFSYRDWYKGLSANWETYVSGVYRRHMQPSPLLVAVAAPVRDQDGNVAGIIVYQVLLEGIADLLKKVEVGQSGSVFLLDHEGTLVAHPKLDLQARIYDEYVWTEVIDNARLPAPKTFRFIDPIFDEVMLATSIPCSIKGHQWVVVAEQSLDETYRPVRMLAFQIGGAGLLVGLLLTACAAWLARYHERVRQLNQRLDELNNELAEENRERRRMYETLVLNLPGMVYRSKNDLDWTMELVSPGCEALTGFPPEALIGNRDIAYADLIHSEDRNRVSEEVQRAVLKQQPYAITYRILTASGEEKWVWEQGRGIFDARNGLLALEGFITDVTAQKSLERQLLHIQKMEAIGRLAGGVADDFNNLIMVISGYCELALQRISGDDELRDQLKEIHKAGERAALLTHQLLAFSRKQILQPVVLDLNTVITEMDQMLRRLLGEDLDLEIHLKPDLHPVKFDPGQIEQIIMNLAINARDAMPDGGKLTIETTNVELDEEYAASHAGARAGSHVMIAITDTGTGMDAETKIKIFEPFFTTKKRDKGTGLGLSTVYGIVAQSGGNIWVYSEPGVGTTFKVYLPRTGESATAAVPPARKHLRARGSETILVVEDEVGVRKVIRSVLQAGGYKVLDTGDVDAVLDICRQYKGKIHLLLTDVVLPGMSGPQLAEKVTRERPEIFVVYMSGYTDDAIVHHGVLDAGTAFIEKPIAPNVLLEKIRGFLG